MMKIKVKAIDCGEQSAIIDVGRLHKADQKQVMQVVNNYWAVRQQFIACGVYLLPCSNDVVSYLNRHLAARNRTLPQRDGKGRFMAKL